MSQRVLKDFTNDGVIQFGAPNIKDILAALREGKEAAHSVHIDGGCNAAGSVMIFGGGQAAASVKPAIKTNADVNAFVLGEGEDAMRRLLEENAIATLEQIGKLRNPEFLKTLKYKGKLHIPAGVFLSLQTLLSILTVHLSHLQVFGFTSRTPCKGKKSRKSRKSSRKSRLSRTHNDVSAHLFTFQFFHRRPLHMFRIVFVMIPL